MRNFYSSFGQKILAELLKNPIDNYYKTNCELVRSECCSCRVCSCGNCKDLLLDLIPACEDGIVYVVEMAKKTCY